jgi:hypothetical protein
MIARGGTAIGTITEAEQKKRMARGGKLGLNIDYVRLVNGEKVALRAVKAGKGGGHTGAMTGAMVATAVVCWATIYLPYHSPVRYDSNRRDRLAATGARTEWLPC